MKFSKTKLYTLLVSFTLCFLISKATITNAQTTTLHVSPGGSGSSCTSSSPCNLNTANNQVQSGQTVYLKSGTYSQDIVPARSGTASNPITYQGESGAKLTGKMKLQGRSYLTIKGIFFETSGHNWLASDFSSHHILITQCEFNQIDPGFYSGIYLKGHHFTLNNNLFHNWYNGNSILVESPQTLIENNDFSQAAAGHGFIIVHSNNVIIRHNYFRNPWDRAIAIRKEEAYKVEDVLVENNLFVDNDWDRQSSHPGAGSERGAGSNVDLLVSRGIFRNNLIIGGNVGKNYSFTATFNNGLYGQVFYSEYLRIYHNTIHKNKLPPLKFSENGSLQRNHQTAFNQIKNNLFTQYNLRDTDQFGEPVIDYALAIQNKNLSWPTWTIEQNLFWDPQKIQVIYLREDGGLNVQNAQSQYPNVFKSNLYAEPKFVDESLLNKADAKPQDYSLSNLDDFFIAFTLTPNSPGKNQAAHLTIVTQSVNNSNTLKVEDALYFFDGFGLTTGDQITLVNNTGQETHTTVTKRVDDNTLTVNPSVSATTGDKIYLQKYGPNPDIGINNLNDQQPTPTPLNTPKSKARPHQLAYQRP